MLARKWRKGSTHTLLVRMYIGAATMKTAQWFLKKLKLPYGPAIPLLYISKENEDTNSEMIYDTAYLDG